MFTKIGVVTNARLRCGNAEYGRDLVTNLQPYFKVEASEDINELVDGGARLLLFNWHPAVVSYTGEIADQLHTRGVKVIVIFQNSFDWRYEVDTEDHLAKGDAVLVHEKMDSNIKLTVIHHGIPIVSDLLAPTEPLIGTAGFPFPWKRFDVVAEAAVKFGAKCLMVAPKHDEVDTTAYMRGIADHLGSLADIHQGWLPTEDVVRRLSQCTLNIFWFESQDISDQLGQSGSVRLGIAARRPIIVSTHRKLKTLLPYLDEIYMAATEDMVYRYTSEILKDEAHARRPNRILAEMGWPTAAEKYKNLIEKVLGKEAAKAEAT